MTAATSARPKKYVRATFVEELRKGSREEFVEKVRQAIWRHRDQFMEGKMDRVAHIATHPGIAVVANATNGKFFRVHFVEDQNGQVALGAVEQLEVPIMNGREVAEGILQDVNSLLLSGHKQEAEKLLKESMGMLSYAAVTNPEDLTKLFIEDRKKEHAWLRYFRANEGPINKFLGIVGEQKSLTTKWESVYNGSANGSGASYRTLIEQDLHGVLQRLESTFAAFTPKLDAYRNSRPAFRTLDEDEQEVVFEAFAEDLRSDLNSTVATIQSILETREPVSMARTYDTVIGQISAIETAGIFVSRMAEANLQGRK